MTFPDTDYTATGPADDNALLTPTAAGLDVERLEILGAERIRVWRFFRLFRAIERVWQRWFWRDADRAHFLLEISEASRPLVDQCRDARFGCVQCGAPLSVPRPPADRAIGRLTFGCARCHAYYYLDAAPNEHVYEHIREQLMAKAARG